MLKSSTWLERVFVAFVGPSEQITDAPDKAGELGVCFAVHSWLPVKTLSLATK
jgi:hypothetical protein